MSLVALSTPSSTSSEAAFGTPTEPFADSAIVDQHGFIPEAIVQNLVVNQTGRIGGQAGCSPRILPSISISRSHSECSYPQS